MASSGEEPWVESEKLFLLAEILKDAQVPVGAFLTVIADARIEPRWDEIPLPPGRSLKSCKKTFQYLMGESAFAPSFTNAPSQSMLSGGAKAPNPRKRPLPPKETSTPGARNLQPRPLAFSSMNGNEGSPYQFSPNEDPNQPPKKKRGRPSKADQEARAAAAAARGELLPTPKPPKTNRGPRSPSSAVKASKTGVQGNTGGPAPTAVMQTPGMAKPGTPGTGSAPKARRGRPTKAESAAKRILLEAAATAAEPSGTDDPAQRHEGGNYLSGTAGNPAGEAHDMFGTSESAQGAFGGGPDETGHAGVEGQFPDTSMHDMHH
ncbi:MAG: hypothetical protein M1837_001674 [Sclerophora amabilis]|nr:MAG: hypothetical protein M1837_001674 [Sclerophora amabilis]